MHLPPSQFSTMSKITTKRMKQTQNEEKFNLQKKLWKSLPQQKYDEDTEEDLQYQSTERCLELKKKCLSSFAQKAVWANAIIRTVIQCCYGNKLPNNISDKSLSERITHIEIKDKFYEFQKRYKTEVLQAFTTGISLDRLPSYNQTQFTDASQGEDSKKIKFHLNYAITPTIYHILRKHNKSCLIYGAPGVSKSFATCSASYLFDFICRLYMEAQTNKRLKEEIVHLKASGLLDILKPVKIWYWTISDALIENIKLNPDKNLKRAKKFFFKQIILNQATELSQQEIKLLEDIDDFEQFQDKIIQLYDQAGIYQRVVIDQVNSVASVIHDSNRKNCQQVEMINYSTQQELKKNKQESEKIKEGTIDSQKKKAEIAELRYEIIKNKQLQLYKFKKSEGSKQHQMSKYLLNLISTFKGFGKSFVFNSSLNIELDLLKKKSEQTKDYELSFEILANHDQVSVHYIPFQQNFKKNWGMADFYHFFWFELNKKLQPKGIRNEKLIRAKQLFLKEACKINLKSYYRPLFIREYLSYESKNALQKQENQSESVQHFDDIVRRLEESQLLHPNKPILMTKTAEENAKFNEREAKTNERCRFKVQTQKQLSQKFNKIVREFEQFCTKKYQQKFEYFTRQKGNQLQKQIKKTFLAVLYQVSKKLKQMGKEKLQFSIRHLQILLGKKLTYYLKSKEHNKELIPISVDDKSDRVQFLWSTSEFYNIAHPILETKSQQIVTKFWNGASLELCEQNVSFRGHVIQFCLIKALRVGTIVEFEIIHETNDKNSEQFRIDHQIFKIEAEVTFLDFNRTQSYNKPTISAVDRNLKKLFTKMRQYHDLAIIATPQKEQDVYDSTKRKYSSNSEAIDFIIARYNSKDEIYEIYTFDVTVSERKDGIKSKFNNIALHKLIEESIKKELKDQKFFIHRIILCGKQLSLPQLRKDNLVICCSSIDNINIVECEYPLELFNFSHLQRWNNQLRVSKYKKTSKTLTKKYPGTTKNKQKK